MKRLLLFLAILKIASCSCPDGFELMRDGECRGYLTTMSVPHYYDIVNTAIAQCQTVDAFPFKILTDEEQSYWPKFRKNNFLPLGLVCNTTTTRWQWVDGTELMYKPPSYASDLDLPCITGCAWNLWDTGLWNNACTTESQTIDVYCTKQLQTLANNGDGCAGFDDDDEDGVCYQIENAVESWQDAQITCKNVGSNLASIHSQKENSFLRRLAVSQKALNGLFLGFPITGLGDCLAMDTSSSTTGEWVNTDCNSTMSVACGRNPSGANKCSDGPWKEGDVITSPGFPYDATVPCDYMFSVASGKRVELEIILLQANTCCDYLVIYENYIGQTVLANLTGEVSDTIYKTKSSNFMRLSWNPNGGVNVRGMMVTFRSVLF